jgi:signal transduction histidine kinase
MKGLGVFPWTDGSQRRRARGHAQAEISKERKVESRPHVSERQLATVIAKIDSIRQKERRQIADELHDQMGQNLILASMKLGMLVSSASKEQAAVLQDVRELIAQSLNQVRSLIGGLYPDELHDVALGPALDGLLRETQRHYGLRCTADIGSVPVTLGHESQKTLLSAVRELLINVAKHAGVKEARVSLRCEDRDIVILVADEGCGFGSKQPEVPLKTIGLGLISLRERVARLGGSFRIDSHPGQGTKATITAPMR